MKYLYTNEFAQKMDDLDPLDKFRERFYFPRHNGGKEVIYLCGNSLGLQPKSTKTAIDEVLGDWRELGVKGHFEAKKAFYNLS